ncbi:MULTISPECIES: hypothetical protein [Streptomyces]|nr:MULTISPECIES: hypothetical protein [Streptomyces]MYS96205.1 hypothetical protein [Streptomyces sp. SID5469]
MAFDDTGDPGLGEARDDGLEVAFEALGEPLEAGQIGGDIDALLRRRDQLAVQQVLAD